MPVKQYSEMSFLELQIIEAAYCVAEATCSSCQAQNDIVAIESQPYSWWGTNLEYLIVTYEKCCGTGNRRAYCQWDTMLKAYFKFLLKGAS